MSSCTVATMERAGEVSDGGAREEKPIESLGVITPTEAEGMASVTAVQHVRANDVGCQDCAN